MVRFASFWVLLLLLIARPAESQCCGPSSDPDSARLVTSDIELFWQVFDQATPENLAELLQREYLDRGTQGLRDFIPHRILSAQALAETITRRRERYEEIRAASLNVAAAERAIRAPFYALKYLYPDAVYPHVYFLIGRLNTGGTASDRGLLIGTEMFRDAEPLPGIVAHELIHFQQKASGQYAAAEAAPSVLALAILEGSASFLGELISGVGGDAAAHEYGRAHERELWEEFEPQMRGTNTDGWFYSDPPGGRPRDLGYFIGYRIVEAYYHRAADKKQAIQDILTARDFEEFLANSGYNPNGS